MRNVHAPGGSGPFPFRPELFAGLVVGPNKLIRAKHETISAGRDRDRTGGLVFLKSQRLAVELGRVIVLPVAELAACSVGFGKTGCKLRLIREATGREIEQDGAFTAVPQAETDTAAVVRNREITSELTAHVGNGAFLPNQLFAIERDQAEGRVRCARCDFIAAGQKLHDGVLSHS